MRLHLRRRYTPRGTLGRLYLGNRQLCFIREAPHSGFNTEVHCLAEGVYLLEAHHSEDKGWTIGMGDRGRILSKTALEKPDLDELCPVTCYRADGTPMFTKLAFAKLLDEFSGYWERREIVELQIVSQGIPYERESCQSVSYF